LRTLKIYLYALGGIPLGGYLLWAGEFLGALVFLGIGAACLLLLLDDHLPRRMPGWTLSAALWCVGFGMLALIVLVARWSSNASVRSHKTNCLDEPISSENAKRIPSVDKAESPWIVRRNRKGAECGTDGI
jgi:hypothetical protein